MQTARSLKCGLAPRCMGSVLFGFNVAVCVTVTISVAWARPGRILSLSGRFLRVGPGFRPDLLMDSDIKSN